MTIDTLNKYGGLIFLYTVGLAFSGLLIYQIIKGIQPDQYALYYIGIAILQATHASGVQQGVNNTNDTVAKTAKAQYPLVQESIKNAASTTDKAA